MSESYINLYTHVESILHLDLSESAAQLEQLFPDAFVEPEEGIYLVGHIKPVITTGKRYYELITTGDKLKYKLLEDIETATGAIVDSTGAVVLSVEQMKNKKRLLVNQPTVPASASNFIRYFLMHEIHSCLRHTSRSNYDSKADSFLTAPRETIGLTDVLIEKILVNEMQQIVNFVLNHKWHTHWFKFENGQLHIMRGMDWRIIEYYRLTQKDSEEDMTSEGYR